MSDMPVERVLDVKAILGEGPIWDADAQILWWVDIAGKKLNRFHPDSGRNESWEVGQVPGTVVGRQKGGVMLAVEEGFAEFDLETSKLRLISNPELDKPENRFNDGKCDPAGRFWAGTMNQVDPFARITGSLYSLDANHQVTKHVDSISISNGIVWTQDAKTMYYIDTATRAVDAFDFDNVAGKVSNRRTVFGVPEGMGMPDGMAIDDQGKLWVAFWDGWQVARICPVEGKVIGKVELPVANVTACAFGGTSLDQLFITTARLALSDEDLQKQPMAGDLFMAQPGVHGVVSTKFAG